MDKTCSKCKETKQLSEFSKNARKPDGFQHWCKKCSKEYVPTKSRIPKNQIPNGMKQCNGCRLVLSLDSFNFHKRDGVRSKCKECQSKDDIKYSKTRYRKRHIKRADIAGTVNDGHTEAQLWNQYGFYCYLCGIKVVENNERITGLYHAEHVVPISSGGNNTLDNVRPSCEPCNSSKWDRPLMEFLIKRQDDLNRWGLLNLNQSDETEYIKMCNELDSTMVCVIYRVSSD